MKRYKLCWTEYGQEKAEQQGHIGIVRTPIPNDEGLTKLSKKLFDLGFTEDMHGYLAPEGWSHKAFVEAVEEVLADIAHLKSKDYSLSESIKELFREADQLQERSEAVREQGRALDAELKRRIEPRVDQWLEGLISSVELLDGLEIEKRRL